MSKMEENKNDGDEYLKYYDKWSRTKSIEIFQVQKKNPQRQNSCSVDLEKLVEIANSKPKHAQRVVDWSDADDKPVF